MVVYGSRARGDADPESDLDFFIEVTDLNAEIRNQIQTAAWEVSLEKGVMISTFIASSYSLEHSLLAANPLLKSIEIDGVVV
jgi:predicted nucleotidyltransferase